MAEISINANEALAKQVGESRMTIQRYIRLTNLIPKVLDMRQSFTDFTRKDLGKEVPARNSNYSTDFTVGTDAKEREDFMRESMAEKKANYKIIMYATLCLSTPQL